MYAASRLAPAGTVIAVPLTDIPAAADTVVPMTTARLTTENCSWTPIVSPPVTSSRAYTAVRSESPDIHLTGYRFRGSSAIVDHTSPRRCTADRRRVNLRCSASGRFFHERSGREHPPEVRGPGGRERRSGAGTELFHEQHARCGRGCRSDDLTPLDPTTARTGRVPVRAVPVSETRTREVQCHVRRLNSGERNRGSRARDHVGRSEERRVGKGGREAHATHGEQ